MNHCHRCQHYVQFQSEPKGLCYGLPPQIFANGYQVINQPEVKGSRPACSCFTALPEAEPTQVHGKVTPETPGDAAKLAYQTKHAATLAPAPATVPQPVVTSTVATGKRRR